MLNDLDPAILRTATSAEISYNINYPLYIFDVDTYNLTPGLAVGEPEVSADGLQWTIALRKDATFADGTPFNAATFKYSIDRAAGFEGTRSARITNWVKEVQVVDDYTIRIILKKKCAFLKALLSETVYFPVNASLFPEDKILRTPFVEIKDSQVWAKENIDQTKVDVKKALGLGPYRIKQLDHDKNLGDYGVYTKLHLEANPTFFGKNKPKSSQIIIHFFQDSAAMLKALEDKTIDIAWNQLDGPHYAKVNQDDNYHKLEMGGVIKEYMGLCHICEPFKDIRVRRAISYAIERKSIQEKTWYGTARPLYSFLPKGIWSHIEPFKDLYGSKPNIKKATELLREAGYDTNNKVKFTLSFSTAYGPTDIMAEEIKTSLEKIQMIDMTLQELKWDDFVSKVFTEPEDGTNPSIQAYLAGLSADYPDPANEFDYFLSAEGTKAGTYIKNNELDQLAIDGATTFDHVKRQEIYKTIQTKWAQHVVTIPLVQHSLFAVTHKDIAFSAKSEPGMLNFGFTGRLNYGLFYHKKP